MSSFLADLLNLDVDGDGPKGVVAVFCLFDLRTPDWGGLFSLSGVVDGGESSCGRDAALRFRDFAGVLEGVLMSGGEVSGSSMFSDSAASLAEERVTLEDMCVNCCPGGWEEHE